MKTLEQFESQELDLDQYLKPLDEIDEELYWHIACGYMPAKYQHGGLIQGGDADDKVGEVYSYATVNEIEGKFYYLGILPEFKQ